MPNWCMNRLEITAETKEKLDEVLEGIRSEKEPLSFEKIFPMPEAFKDPNVFVEVEGGIQSALVRLNNICTGQEKDYKNWREFSLGEWGCKWDVNGVDFHDDMGEDNEAILSFDTAWSPPDKIVDKLIDMYPDANFKLLFFEPGCCFAGEYGNDLDVTYTDNDEYQEYAEKTWGSEWFEEIE